MSIALNSRVYIDSSVWVYYLFQKTHPENKYCMRLFNQLQRREIVGIATDFVVAEIMGVLKRVLSEAKDVEPTVAELTAAQQTIDSAMKALGIEIFSSDDLAEGISVTAPVFERVTEVVVASNPTKGRDKAWRVVGGADAVHIALAERATSQVLATCDQGFKGVKANLSSVILREEYP